jgi:GntR family transcriptional regulator of arabinose operon
MHRKVGRATASPKYQTLFESLKADIVSGRFQPGQKLPSEAALVNRSGHSRITVSRALRELQNVGLIHRVAGSGSFVSQRDGSDKRPLLFGLIIPDLGETEIFEPICQAIASAPEAEDHALLWGRADMRASKTEQSLRLVQQFIDRKVSGVFFAPLEFESNAEKANRRILAALQEARIPVVLLDRRASKAPERNRPDLVGLNNRQAGYIATEHLLKLGCNRIGFLGYHGWASTVDERMSGYKEALAAYGVRPPLDSALQADSAKGSDLHWGNTKKIEALDAFVCINDRVAGQLMHAFILRGLSVPGDIRIVGIDDVAYASLLPVPLTTVRQPTREIGETALRVMLDRLRTPALQPREILLDGELIVRQSCGAD